MDDSINKEIVRLVREIADDEEKLRKAEKNAAQYHSAVFSRPYEIEARSIARSIERKFALLALLKVRA